MTNVASVKRIVLALGVMAAAGVVLPLSAVTAVLHGFASAFGDDMHAYLLTGQRQSSDDIWPRERTLAVS